MIRIQGPSGSGSGLRFLLGRDPYLNSMNMDPKHWICLQKYYDFMTLYYMWIKILKSFCNLSFSIFKTKVGSGSMIFFYTWTWYGPNRMQKIDIDLTGFSSLPFASPLLFVRVDRTSSKLPPSPHPVLWSRSNLDQLRFMRPALFPAPGSEKQTFIQIHMNKSVLKNKGR